MMIRHFLADTLIGAALFFILCVKIGLSQNANHAWIADALFYAVMFGMFYYQQRALPLFYVFICQTVNDAYLSTDIGVNFLSTTIAILATTTLLKSMHINEYQRKPMMPFVCFIFVVLFVRYLLCAVLGNPNETFTITALTFVSAVVMYYILRGLFDKAETALYSHYSM